MPDGSRRAGRDVRPAADPCPPRRVEGDDRRDPGRTERRRPRARTACSTCATTVAASPRPTWTGSRFPAGCTKANYIGGRIQTVDPATGERHRPLHRVRRATRCWRPTTSSSTPTAGSTSPTTASSTTSSGSHQIAGIYYAQADGSGIKEVVYPSDDPNGIGLSPDGIQAVLGRDVARAASMQRDDRARPARSSSQGSSTRRSASTASPASSCSTRWPSTRPATCASRRSSTAGSRSSRRRASSSTSSRPATCITTNICFGGDDLTTAYITLSTTGRLVKTTWPRPGAGARAPQHLIATASPFDGALAPTSEIDDGVKIHLATVSEARTTVAGARGLRRINGASLRVPGGQSRRRSRRVDRVDHVRSADDGPSHRLRRRCLDHQWRVNASETEETLSNGCKNVTEIVHDGRVTRRRMLLGDGRGDRRRRVPRGVRRRRRRAARRRRLPPAQRPRRPARRHDGRRQRATAAGSHHAGDGVAAATWRAARDRRGQRRQGQDRRARRRPRAHRHRLVLRQDDDARPRPGGQAHRGRRRPDVQLHLPRPQVGRRRRPASRR